MRCVDRAQERDVIESAFDTDLAETNTKREELHDFRRIALGCSGVLGVEKMQNGLHEVSAGGQLPKHELAVTRITCC